MAVLMNNTASSPTEPGGNEEAPDVQDPCKDLIELRLKKVWKRDEEKDRPNEVIFNITRSYEKDGKPVVDTNFNKEVILTKKDAQTSDIWEKVLTGAEYTAYHVGTDGKKYYYTYHVSEMKVDGYTTEITYKGDRQYSITVTNTKNWFDSLLPETGGMGKALLYTLVPVQVGDNKMYDMESIGDGTTVGTGMNLKLNGLAEGSYWLVETQAPDGYNKLTAPVKITITKSDTTNVDDWTIKQNDGVVDDKIIDIENTTGTLLPETGGMGTVIFTVIAVVMILGIAVSFVISRRKRA